MGFPKLFRNDLNTGRWLANNSLEEGQLLKLGLVPCEWPQSAATPAPNGVQSSPPAVAEAPVVAAPVEIPVFKRPVGRPRKVQ